MNLQALVLCSDEKIVRVLRRVLGDLEVDVEHCENAESAIRKLTRNRFEAVIVDCDDLPVASQVLKSARSAPCNKRAVAVAIVDGQMGVRVAFEMGAHFVLYKPISGERAKSSFRAARALMKRERRRNSRLAVQIPVTFTATQGGPAQRTVTSDLSEAGMALQMARGPKASEPMCFHFTLPGAPTAIEVSGEVAWENPSGQVGIRFVSLSPETQEQLRAWLNRNSPEPEQEDPPVRCKLTDLSLGGCYLEIASPFPVHTRVALSMRVAQLEVRAEGIVRIMHPEAGMGVEFTQSTPEQHQNVEKFIQALMNSKGSLPDLLVVPEGLEGESSPRQAVLNPGDDMEDPLLELFRHKAELPPDAFLGELRKQRRAPSAGASMPD